MMKKKVTHPFSLVLSLATLSHTMSFSAETLTKPTAAFEFNADLAYQLIAKQVSFGPRVSGTSASKKCSDWIQSELKKAKLETMIQTAAVTTPQGKKITLRNVIGKFNPKNEKRILLSAHYDSRPFADQDTKRKKEPILGANDGASGVGVLLSLASDLQKLNPKVGIDFVFWDAEDLGQPEKKDSYCLGSQYWAKNFHPRYIKPLFGINLDMVGAANPQFAKEGFSRFYAPQIIEKVWKAAERAKAKDLFSNEEDDLVIDDHYYVNRFAQIPTIDLIHRDPNTGRFFPEWHTHGDTLKIISKDTLKKVGQTLVEVLQAE